MIFVSYTYKIDGVSHFGSSLTPQMPFAEDFNDFGSGLKDHVCEKENVTMDEKSFSIVCIAILPTKNMIQKPGPIPFPPAGGN